MSDPVSMTAAQAVRHILDHAMADDDDVVLLGDAVGRAGGSGGSTEGLLARFGARVRDLPIADRGTLGYALGLALGGLRPVVELADASRLLAGLEVLGMAGHLAQLGDFDVPLVVRVPYGAEAPGLDAPVGPWLPRLPGVRVVVPSSAQAAADLLRTAIADTAPTVILEPRALWGHAGPVRSGSAAQGLRVVREGRHVTVACWGGAVQASLAAADTLADDGIDAQVVDLVQLSPLDAAGLGAAVRSTGRLVVAHPNDPALAAIVRGAALDAAFLYLESPLSDAPSDPSRIARAAAAAVHF